MEHTTKWIKAREVYRAVCQLVWNRISKAKSV